MIIQTDKNSISCPLESGHEFSSLQLVFFMKSILPYRQLMQGGLALFCAMLHVREEILG